MPIFGRSTTKRVVRDLYRAILGREPDEEGARTYERLIEKLGAEHAVPKIVDAFTSSLEYRGRMGALADSHVNATLASHGSRLINGVPVEHLVSLGTFCLPALMFKNYGLRQYSMPFDWIFSTPQMVRDCLTDDFATFLDRRQYISISHEGSEPAAAHELFRERYGLVMPFAHRDPTREADYQYFVRCVTRFRQLLRSDDSKLFVVIAPPTHLDLANQFAPLVQALSKVTTNFALLGIELSSPNEPDPGTLVSIARMGDHALYRFTPSAFNPQGVFLPDKLDEWSLLRLVYRYKLALKDSAWNESERHELVQCANSPQDQRSP